MHGFDVYLTVGNGFRGSSKVWVQHLTRVWSLGLAFGVWGVGFGFRVLGFRIYGKGLGIWG